MLKTRNRFLISLMALATILLFTAQSTKDKIEADSGLPPDLSHQLDSLRRADNLAAWLYACRAYVYEEPTKRIGLLAKTGEQIWRIPKTDGEREEWFNGLAAQGYYLLYNGNILGSIDAYEKAYRFYFDQPIPGVDVLEYVLKPLGNNYTRLGDYDRAFLIQEKSLALAIDADTSQIPSISHNLATTAIWKEDYPQALRYCESGIQKVVQQSALHGLLLSTFSELLLRTGKTDLAEQQSRKAIQILTSQLANKDEYSVPYWLRGAWQGLGDIQRTRQEPLAALNSYRKAIALIDKYDEGKRKREKAKLLVSAASMRQQLQQLEAAAENYNEALSLMIPVFKPDSANDLPNSADLYGENTLLDALHGKADCLRKLNKKKEALSCYMLLYTVGQKLRNEFFSRTAKSQQQKECRQWSESAIATAFDLWKNTGEEMYAHRILQIAEMSKSQLLLDELKDNLRFNRLKNKDELLQQEDQLIQAISFYDKESAGQMEIDSQSRAQKNEWQIELALIQKRVREKYPLQEQWRTAESGASIDSLLQNIESGTTVYEFFFGEKDIYRIQARQGKIREIRKIEKAGAIDTAVQAFVERYFHKGPAAMMNQPSGYYTEANALYRSLWPEGTGTDDKNTLVIPDGVLGYLPFDALVTDSVFISEPGQWPLLVKKTNLYFGYSLQTRLQQQEIAHPAGPFAGFFISFDSSKQLALPAVKKEFDEIDAVINGRYFTEEKATLGAFNKQLTEVNLLHISTHSFLQGDENIPVLQLADDRFYLFELYGKSFHPQLVVLSACRTGQGMLAKGEGIISLARGFTATGAAGIVAGLWDMNDESTATLMGSFYKRLADGNYPANALHEAKQEWLKNGKANAFQKLPYFWAGLVYSGDNSPVDLQNTKADSIWWLIAIGLGVVGLIFLVKKRRLFFN